MSVRSARKYSASTLPTCRFGRFGFYPISAAVLLALAFDQAIAPASFLVLFAVTWLLVLAHELGHAAAGRLSGFRVERIAAYPVYGITTVRRPKGRRTESCGWLATVIAGPAAGAAVSMLALAGLAALGATPPLPSLINGSALTEVLLAGLADQVLNLLPLHRAFDGARAIDEIRRIRSLRGADARIRRIRHAAAVSIHVPPSEGESAPGIRRAA